MVEKQILDSDRLNIDKVDSEPGKSDEPRTKKNEGADNQFFGGWYSYRTTHAFTVNATTPADNPIMFERIQLVKPFEIHPVP